MSPLVPRPSDLPLVDGSVSPLHRGNSGWIGAPFQRQPLRANTISLGLGESSSPHLAAVKNHFFPPQSPGHQGTDATEAPRFSLRLFPQRGLGLAEAMQ